MFVTPKCPITSLPQRTMALPLAASQLRCPFVGLAPCTSSSKSRPPVVPVAASRVMFRLRPRDDVSFALATPTKNTNVMTRTMMMRTLYTGGGVGRRSRGDVVGGGGRASTRCGAFPTPGPEFIAPEVRA